MIGKIETEKGHGLGHPGTRRGVIAQDQGKEEDTSHVVDHHEKGDVADEADLETEIEETGEGGMDDRRDVCAVQ